jgi:hypothetical protein
MQHGLGTSMPSHSSRAAALDHLLDGSKQPSRQVRDLVEHPAKQLLDLLAGGAGLPGGAEDRQSGLSLEESSSDPATAKCGHNTNIRNVSRPIGVRRFADVLVLLDPAGDEACENRITLRD